MFVLTPDFKDAMSARINTTPVNAHLLLLKSGIAYDEYTLPKGQLSILKRDPKQGFSFTVTTALSLRGRNQACAHGIAHLLLHADLFDDNACHIDALEGPIASHVDPLTAAQDVTARSLALEILIPTISLRTQCLYHEGRVLDIAKAFDLPASLIKQAMVRANLLDKRAVA